MKIETTSNELRSCICKLSGIVDMLPTAAVTIATREGIVVVRANDRIGAAELKIAARVLEPGEVNVCRREILAACKSCPNDIITVSAADDSLTIGTDSGCVTLAAVIDTTPPIVVPGGAPDAELKYKDVAAALSDVEHAQCRDLTRPAINGVNLELATDMTLRAIATDGRRLAVSARKTAYVSLVSPALEIFLPTQATGFLLSLPSADTVAIHVGAETVWLEAGQNRCAFSYSSRFPDWRKCIPPKDLPLRAKFDADKLAYVLWRAINALDVHADETDEDGEPVETRFAAHIHAGGADGKAEITVRNADSELSTARFFAIVDCATPDGQGFVVDVNARYLLEAMLGHKGPVQVCEEPIAAGPLLFKYPKKPDYFEVVMPLRQ